MSENTQMMTENILESSKIQPPSSKIFRRYFGGFDTPPFKRMVIENESPRICNKNSQIYNMDREMSVSTDHCYARPWNWRPESNFLRPTKTLFIPRHAKKKSANPLAPVQDCDDIIDIESIPEEPSPIYDVSKSKQLMDECLKHASLARTNDNDEWEENISKINWTPLQTRLFNGVVTILNSDHMARLAQTNCHNEAILRRNVIDKSVQRLRRLMATVAWEPKHVQWLHHLLIDHLNTNYLAIYLDILQTLKSKVPTLLDKMMYGPTSSAKVGVLSNESLFPLLKKTWDPVAYSLMQDKPKKLPTNPIIVIIPSSPNIPKRMAKWITLLSNLASVVTVPVNLGSAVYRMTMVTCLDQLYSATRGKIQEIKNECPGRNIILVGFNAGATLALQVAQVEPVLCVICLGFSLLTAEGKRGDPEDVLLELQYPVLFVIGQCSNTSIQEDMEDIREKMRVETGLIVVGSADDNLRVNKKKKKLEGITQSVVDRCIVDEVGEFVSGIILSPYPPQIRQSPTHIPGEVKKSKNERIRYNSNASSMESEPPSPTPRITRPGQNNTSSNFGRPPGSKSKSKLDTKWANQGIPSSPTLSTSPPPQITPVTPDTSSNDSSIIPPLIIDKPPEPIFIPKKIKTLKPVMPSTDNKTIKTILSPVKGQSTVKHRYISNRVGFPGNTLSNLLQGKPPPPSYPKSSASSIKLLENVTLNSPNSTKFVSNTGRTIDLSKVTVLNSISTSKSGGLGNVVLLPDGKIKAVSPSIKGKVSTTSVLVPHISKRDKMTTGASLLSFGTTNRKYITSKKQLMGNTPSQPIKNVTYMPQTSLQTNLPPPTNLTTQDIMDLPIIFADDNQILESNTPNNNTAPQIITPPQPMRIQPPSSKIITSAGNKFVLLNKQMTVAHTNNFIITPTNIKKVPAVSSIKNSKLTKIILSSKKDDLKSSVVSQINNLSSEISVKKVAPAPPLEIIDLENELVATAVPKPNLASSDVKNITIINKKTPEDVRSEILAKNVTIKDDNLKRTASEAEITEGENDTKTVKLSTTLHD